MLRSRPDPKILEERRVGPEAYPTTLPSSEPEPFDTILTLDCAYYSTTRRLFLAQSFQNLAPAGRIALADICFSSLQIYTLPTRILTAVLKLIPVHNLISSDAYVAQLEENGYVDVTLEDITPHVFPGFAAFLKSRGWGWWVVDWYASAGARFVIVTGKKPS